MRMKLILGFILLEMLCSAIGHSAYNEEKFADDIIGSLSIEKKSSQLRKIKGGGGRVVDLICFL